MAEARPLRLGPIDLPIDRVGDYDVVLASVTLPNGILSSASLQLADEVQRDFVLEDGSLRLEVRRQEGLRWNVHDWHPGVDEAEVHVLFTVESFTGDAALRIASVSVR